MYQGGKRFRLHSVRISFICYLFNEADSKPEYTVSADRKVNERELEIKRK
jgi:hypothetical protein